MCAGGATRATLNKCNANSAHALNTAALLDSPALRRFVGIDLGGERVPDATTLLRFRHRLEDNKLGCTQPRGCLWIRLTRSDESL